MEELRIKIGKMTCVNCSNAIERACKKIDGVKDASVSYVNSSGVFLLEDQEKRKDIIAKIKNLGFEILEDEQSLNAYKVKKHLELRKNLLLSIVLSVIIMYFEMFVKSSFSQNIQMALSFFGIFYCGRDFFSHAFLGLKSKNLDMNTLVALGTLSAFVYSFLVYLQIFKEEDLYFSGAMMIISFVLLGKYLESKAKFKAQDYQRILENIDTKKTKILLEDESIKEISSSFVKSGDVLLVKEGESIVADGVVLLGSAELDMSFLNGEFLPVLKKEGDEVQAGAVVLNGTLRIKANKKAMDSTLEQIKNLVFEAGNIKSPLANLADQISKYFVGSIIFFAFLVFVFWALKADLNTAFLHACAVLLISCPCALGLATPIALVVASSNAAKNFILIKNPAALEKLALVKYAFFDKTGTLTKENLSIFKHNLSKDDFDKLCQIESLSSHPIAKALHKDQIFDLKGEGRVIVGSGIKYKEDSDIYLAGSAKFLHENEIDTKESDIFFDTFKEYVRVYFAKNKKCLGGVLLSNALKDGAKELVLNLKKQNLKTFILSGDHVKNVEKIAKELQIDEFYAQLKSEEKLRIIQKFKKTLFVGDGINDAAALSAATVSMSFSKANELAKKTGDFILIKDDLSAIFKCFKLAKKTRSIIKLNLFWAFIYNVLCIPIAAGFVPFITLSPHIAALAMCFSSITVVLNSLRLKRI
ncbi:copper-translocating P-type ATPase CopA [Campylobacter jejuni]|uniref:Copper-transporting ATPase n=1 Tax=Campylobacter jejuni TaxID=197 RepID=A0A5T1IB27_CAMJU|nr:copper-translocating P-type ATPase CopA [Campylobacter jejuni]EAH4915290.1 cation-translocating P-type ATPase [Campylobacter jejuni]EAH6980967.1 copper-translocating P-type ATPase CopA [Campylobacter jejuni]EAH7331011.1 copper-translocating P-type ATPase CopA [Campylobacter jejuni]EAH7512660.1 copper-translocating P-type ATPase CopA [Campylobacter jejuni]EAH8270856.1 copper-translocating P-type ATPase CopA [Campylobacter jejuni]